MEKTYNEKQQKVINFLKEHKGETFTLAEIGKAIGIEIKSGTTNTLVKTNVIVCHKNAREIVCECCGHKTKVSTYEIVGATK